MAGGREKVPTLGWIPFLTEAGTVREWATKEAEALDHWRKLEGQIKTARSQVRAIRKRAQEDVGRLGWTAEDIATARRLEAEDAQERGLAAQAQRAAERAQTEGVVWTPMSVACSTCGVRPGSACKGTAEGMVHATRALLCNAAERGRGGV